MVRLHRPPHRIPSCRSRLAVLPGETRPQNAASNHPQQPRSVLYGTCGNRAALLLLSVSLVRPVLEGSKDQPAPVSGGGWLGGRQSLGRSAVSLPTNLFSPSGSGPAGFGCLLGPGAINRALPSLISDHKLTCSLAYSFCLGVSTLNLYQAGRDGERQAWRTGAAATRE